MATDPKIVERICRLADPSRPLTAKPMFGEYGLYLDGKMIGTVCDGRLFVKPTASGRALLDAAEAAVVEASPYPGARPSFVVDPARHDRDFMKQLFDATAQALPVPRPKGRKSGA